MNRQENEEYRDTKIIGKKMKNTEIPKYKAKNNVGSTASVARSSMVKMKIKNNA